MIYNVNSLNTSVESSVSPKVQLSINPELLTHAVYTTKTKINERERVSWSRLWLSAHSLAIEEGRWNRRGRGRLPVQERLCECDKIQTEAHVFKQCPKYFTVARTIQYHITCKYYGGQV